MIAEDLAKYCAYCYPQYRIGIYPSAASMWSEKYTPDNSIYPAMRVEQMGIGQHTIYYLRYMVEHNLDIVISLNNAIRRDPPNRTHAGQFMILEVAARLEYEELGHILWDFCQHFLGRSCEARDYSVPELLQYYGDEYDVGYLPMPGGIDLACAHQIQEWWRLETRSGHALENLARRQGFPAVRLLGINSCLYPFRPTLPESGIEQRLDYHLLHDGEYMEVTGTSAIDLDVDRVAEKMEVCRHAMQTHLGWHVSKEVFDSRWDGDSCLDLCRELAKDDRPLSDGGIGPQRLVMARDGLEWLPAWENCK